MNVIERINMLKKMVKEAERIVAWQADIYTALHNIHADWVVSGILALARIPHHHDTHEPGGADEVTGVAPGAHAASHEDTGADEINVGGLSGELADNQPPKAHKNTHDPIDGSDKLDTATPVKVGSANAIGSSHSLARADHVHEREHAIYTHPTTGTCPQAPKAHESTHVAGGSDDIDSALAIAAMADLSDGKIWAGNGSNRPAEVDWPVGAPSGLIGIWHGTIANIPSGWVICDGNNGTPNLLGRFVEGVATAVTNPGATGGEATHRLTIAEMPAHTHSGILKGGTDWWMGEYSGISFGSTNSTGGGGSHQNKPPYYDVAFLMKT